MPYGKGVQGIVASDGAKEAEMEEENGPRSCFALRIGVSPSEDRRRDIMSGSLAEYQGRASESLC